jgi:hypothetical protein
MTCMNTIKRSVSKTSLFSEIESSDPIVQTELFSKNEYEHSRNLVREGEK